MSLHWSTLTWNGSSCWSPINRLNRSVWKLFVLDRNTWNHITMCKSFILKIVTWSHNCSLRIIITIICLKTICFRWKYLKPYKCGQTNYYLIGIVTLNYILVYRLLVLDRNTWERITLYELFVLDYLLEAIIVYKWILLVTWNYHTACKNLSKNTDFGIK